MNFWTTIADPIKYQNFQRLVELTPLSEEAFNFSRSDTGKAVNFFIHMRQSRQGLGTSYCTPTSRTRRGMNENVSA